MKFVDLTGRTFDRLYVVCRVENNKFNQIQYLCRCDCKNEKVICGNSLKRGVSTSCGCYRKEYTSKARKKHGLCKDKIYNIYHEMKHRCYNPNHKDYADYGGRGIGVDEEIWLDKEIGVVDFYNWATSNGYHKGLSLDRIDNSKGYSKENCRWVTQKEQCNNTRRNRYISYNNETKTISQWAESLKINMGTLHSRNGRGWSVERMLTTPIRNANKRNRQ